MSTTATRKNKTRGMKGKGGVSELLVAPITNPSENDLSNKMYEEGPYHWSCKRQPGMPPSIVRETGIVSNLGSDKQQLSKEAEKLALESVKFRAHLLESHNSLVKDDSLVKFFKDVLQTTPRMSYLQPGSEIMSMCKIKAEFWLLHLDVTQRDKLYSHVKGLCKNCPNKFDCQTVGITVPFRFKQVDRLTAKFGNTVGLMNIELSKMKWGKDGKDAKKSNTVVEISVCQTDRPIYDGVQPEKELTEQEDMEVQFVTDMGQFVKPSFTYVNRMTKKDVSSMLKQYGFRSHLLELMEMNGKQLLRLFGHNKDLEKLSAAMSMSVQEVRRLMHTVNMISRRATPGKYNEARSSQIKRHNTAEIEILPMYKPVQIRCNTALSLESEIRATAEVIVNELLDMNEMSEIKIARNLAVSKTNEEWEKAREEERYKVTTE